MEIELKVNMVINDKIFQYVDLVFVYSFEVGKVVVGGGGVYIYNM